MDCASVNFSAQKAQQMAYCQISLNSVGSCRVTRRVRAVLVSSSKGFGQNKSPQKTATSQKTDNIANFETSKKYLEVSNNQQVDRLAGNAAEETNVGSTPLRSEGASRDQVLAACWQTSALIAAFGFGLHQVAPLVSPAAHDGQGEEALKALLSWSALPNALQIGVALVLAGGVTGARHVLLATWPAFREATDISNTQTLSQLSGPVDVATVSIIPALAEELLFRGALLPSIYPDWRGAAVAGAVFGVLHINGGRNAAFGVWAGLVGMAYGLAFLATGNLLVPVFAHGLANVAAATLWIRKSAEPETVSNSID